MENPKTDAKVRRRKTRSRFSFCSRTAVFFIRWRGLQDTALAAAKSIYLAYAPRLGNLKLDGIEGVR
jgi:hypothetical protein